MTKKQRAEFAREIGAKCNRHATPEVHAMVRAASALYTGNAIPNALHRQIGQLETAIPRLEQRLKFLHAAFPSAAPERTEPDSAQLIENTDNEVPKPTENEPTGVAPGINAIDNRPST